MVLQAPLVFQIKEARTAAYISRSIIIWWCNPHHFVHYHCSCTAATEPELLAYRSTPSKYDISPSPLWALCSTLGILPGSHYCVRRYSTADNSNHSYVQTTSTVPHRQNDRTFTRDSYTFAVTQSGGNHTSLTQNNSAFVAAGNAINFGGQKMQI